MLYQSILLLILWRVVSRNLWCVLHSASCFSVAKSLMWHSNKKCTVCIVGTQHVSNLRDQEICDTETVFFLFCFDKFIGRISIAIAGSLMLYYSLLLWACHLAHSSRTIEPFPFLNPLSIGTSLSSGTVGMVPTVWLSKPSHHASSYSFQGCSMASKLTDYRLRNDMPSSCI